MDWHMKERAYVFSVCPLGPLYLLQHPLSIATSQPPQGFMQILDIWHISVYPNNLFLLLYLWEQVRQPYDGPIHCLERVSRPWYKQWDS